MAFHHVSPQFWDWVELELERARRYGHDVALLRFDLPTGAASQDETSAWLAQHLRATDHWSQGPDGFYVLAPEIDRDGAMNLVARLRADLTDVAATGAVACFPDDALTCHALIEELRAGVRPAAVPRLDDARWAS